MKLNWKSGLVYFVVIQAYTLLFSFFLSGFIVIPVRFIFTEEGLLREIATLVALFVCDNICRFAINFATFKNNRNLTFSQFCLDYLITIGARFVFSLCTFFSAWSAGSAISTAGILIASNLINKDIITMQQVPTYIYIIVFVVFEGFTILTALLAHKISTAIRNKEKAKLLNEAQGK
ncbi:MAG: hypothetical protein IJ400_05410 [Clostridia bacterium]|nr:hypothetical protein [Clostridia bacterium]